MHSNGSCKSASIVTTASAMPTPSTAVSIPAMIAF